MPTGSVTKPARRRGIPVAVGGIVLAALGFAAWLGLRSGSVDGTSQPGAIVEEAMAAEEPTIETPEGTAEEPQLATPESPQTNPGSDATPPSDSPPSDSPSPTSQAPQEAAPTRPTAPAVETFQLASDPPGARIWVDGRPLSTPAALELLPGASYRLRLELEGYESLDRSLSLESLSTSERSDRRVTIALARRARINAAPLDTEPADPQPIIAPAEASAGLPTQPTPTVETAPSEVPGETPPPSAAPDPGVATAAIRRLLDSYEDAYSALDVAAVARIWPSIDADRRARLEESFSSLRTAGLSQTVDLDCRAPTLDGDRASVSCSQSVTVTSGNRQMNTADSELDIDLERVDDSWVIRSVRSQ